MTIHAAALDVDDVQRLLAASDGVRRRVGIRLLRRRGGWERLLANLDALAGSDQDLVDEATQDLPSWIAQSRTLYATPPVELGQRINGLLARAHLRREVRREIEFALHATSRHRTGERNDAAARRLLELMGELSERAYHAGWMQDLEFDLWDAVANGPRACGVLEVDAAAIDDLAKLSSATGGWWYWDETSDEPRFVRADEWQRIYTARRSGPA